MSQTKDYINTNKAEVLVAHLIFTIQDQEQPIKDKGLYTHTVPGIVVTLCLG